MRLVQAAAAPFLGAAYCHPTPVLRPTQRHARIPSPSPETRLRPNGPSSPRLPPLHLSFPSAGSLAWGGATSGRGACLLAKSSNIPVERVSESLDRKGQGVSKNPQKMPATHPAPDHSPISSTPTRARHLASQRRCPCRAGRNPSPRSLRTLAPSRRLSRTRPPSRAVPARTRRTSDRPPASLWRMGRWSRSRLR